MTRYLVQFSEFGIWNGHWESWPETYSTLLFLFLACLRIFIERKKSIYICVYIYIYIYIYIWTVDIRAYICVHTCRCSVFSTLWFILRVFMELQTIKKNGGVAINEPLRGPANGPVDRSWNRAFCYGLPVLYKLFWLLLTVNDSTPVFTYYFKLCASTTVLSEILIVFPANWGSSFALYCMMPKVVKIRKVETCKYGEGSWSLAKVHNNNNNNNNNNNILYSYSHYYVFG